MRPYIGMVSLKILLRISGLPDCFMALIPRSERARLMDLVKLSGMVLGSRRSIACQIMIHKVSCTRKAIFGILEGKIGSAI